MLLLFCLVKFFVIPSTALNFCFVVKNIVSEFIFEGFDIFGHQKSYIYFKIIFAMREMQSNNNYKGIECLRTLACYDQSVLTGFIYMRYYI